MRLVELAIRRMPGIHDPFTLGAGELGEGVLVIHGPNGVGKSTLCRAAHALLWPRTFTEQAISVEARFADGEHVWHAQRDGARVEWQRDGAPSAPPDVPDDHLARCFLVTVDDLYGSDPERGDRDGGWFAELVLREMAGGYDVREVRGLFERGARHGHAELKALNEARGLVARRQRDQERVLAEERTLEDLEREHAEARAAAAELEALGTARELQRARERLEGTRARLAAFPAASERVSGGELEQLEKLDQDLADLRGKLRGLERRASEARQGLAASRLEAVVPQEELDEQGERLDELRERERELAEAVRRRDAAGAQQDDARARLGGEVDPQRLLAPSDVGLEDVERVVREAQVLAHERDAVEAQLRALPPAQELPGDDDELAAGARALAAWLRTPAPVEATPSAWGWLAVALSAATALAVGALLHPAGFALLLATAALAWMLLRRRPVADARAPLVEQFALTRLQPPRAWVPTAVEERLAQLEEQRAQRGRARQDQVLRDRLEDQRRDLEQRERGLEQRREQIGSELGIEVPRSDLALVDLAASVLALREAHGEALAAAERVETLTRQRDELRAVLAAWARGRDETPGEDAAGLARALTSVGRRGQALREAQVELGHVEAERRERRAALDELEAARRALFEQLDLEPDDRAGLARLVEQRPARQAAELEQLEVQVALRTLETRLQGAEGLADLAPGELEQRLEQAQAQAAEQEQLVGRIHDIRRGVRDARERSDLEEARAIEELALARLEEAREAALRAEAGRLLVDEVEREHERLSRPAVLSRAAELFAGFTSHRYDLEVHEVEGRPALRALDERRGRVGLDPEQLSSGTRAQLLLAARLAFAGHAERGPRLPIFVDDALATSDPDRLRAIARSLLALAREEQRQVIVLTKDEGDVGLIRSVAEGAPLRVIDLAALRRQATAQTRRERLELPATRRVPAPGGREGPDYARALGVPALDPWRPLAEAHLYHLVPDDLELLHRLLSWGVERVGPLRALLASGGSLSLAEGARARIVAWLELARGVHASWRTGRGTPLTREALRACEAISETFQERVEGLAEELGWDARALVEALRAGRVERFRSSKAEEAEAWLEERGHLSADAPLTCDGAWVRLLRDMEAFPTEARPGAEILRRRFDYLWEGFGEGAA